MCIQKDNGRAISSEYIVVTIKLLLGVTCEHENQCDPRLIPPYALSSVQDLIS